MSRPATIKDNAKNNEIMPGTLRPRKIRPSSCFMILLSAAILSGCLTYGPGTGHLSGTGPATRSQLEYFGYTDAQIQIQAGPFRDWGLYEVQSLQLPLFRKEGVKQNSYTLYYYRPKGRGPHPAVVILPITRGDYFTQNFAIYLAEHGFACLRFESTKNFTDDAYKTLASAESLIRHYVIDVRRGIDWLLTQEEINPGSIGIMGISLGGIVASITMEADPRIKSGVFLLGGGDLAGIIDTSEENSLIKFRRRVMEHEKLDAKGFREAATRLLKPVDPLSYARRLDPEKVLMINGYFDLVIRRDFVKTFWESSGQPELVFIPTGHYSSGLLIVYARAKTLAHFNKTLW